MTSSEPSESTSSDSRTWRGDRRSSRRIGADERPSTAVVLALAAATGREPTDLTPPLHAFVDPEALDVLVDGGREGLRIEFEAYQCRIAVEGDVVEIDCPGAESGGAGIGESSGDAV